MSKPKFVIGIICILLLTIAAFTGYRFYLSQRPDDGIELKKQIKYLSEENDVKVLWYGEEAKFPKGFPLSYISNLSNENWQKNNDYVFLFVNDLEGKTRFTKEDAVKIKNYADTHGNFYFYYLGTKKLDIFKSVYKDSTFEKDDMSFGYEVYEGDRIQAYGLWDTTLQESLKETPENFQEVIMNAIERIVRENENDNNS